MRPSFHASAASLSILLAWYPLHVGVQNQSISVRRNCGNTLILPMNRPISRSLRGRITVRVISSAIAFGVPTAMN